MADEAEARTMGTGGAEEERPWGSDLGEETKLAGLEARGLETKERGLREDLEREERRSSRC